MHSARKVVDRVRERMQVRASQHYDVALMEVCFRLGTISGSNFHDLKSF